MPTRRSLLTRKTSSRPRKTCHHLIPSRGTSISAATIRLMMTSGKKILTTTYRTLNVLRSAWSALVICWCLMLGALFMVCSRSPLRVILSSTSQWMTTSAPKSKPRESGNRRSVFPMCHALMYSSSNKLAFALSPFLILMTRRTSGPSLNK